MARKLWMRGLLAGRPRPAMAGRRSRHHRFLGRPGPMSGLEGSYNALGLGCGCLPPSDDGRPRRSRRRRWHEEDYADRFEAPAGTVTSASWWIDQRDIDPADTPEPLADVSVDTEAATVENRC